jgi:hypothetical protein
MNLRQLQDTSDRLIARLVMRELLSEASSSRVAHPREGRFLPQHCSLAALPNVVCSSDAVS